MNPKEVTPAETERFAELLESLTTQANQLPANPNNKQLQTALHTAIATFMLQGDILGKILAAQAGTRPRSDVGTGGGLILRLLTMQHSACFLLTSNAFRRAICIVAQRPLAKGYSLLPATWRLLASLRNPAAGR
jgi:hypothetical protein